MAGTMTEVASNGGTVPAYVSVPPSGSGPGVVVIQEWWGLVPHIRDVTDRFASQGFVAMAPDLYHGKETTEPDEAQKMLMSLRIDEAAKDMAGAVDALLAMPETTGDRVGAVGFCMGGGLALYLASVKPEVGAAVCYYGFPLPGTQWDLTAIKGGVIGHFGEHDDFANRALADDMERQLRDGGVDVTFYHYPGTTHAFFNDTRPEVHAPEASALTWQRTLDFLRGRLAGAS